LAAFEVITEGKDLDAAGTNESQVQDPLETNLISRKAGGCMNLAADATNAINRSTEAEDQRSIAR